MTEYEKREAELETTLAYRIHYGYETDQQLIGHLALYGMDDEHREHAIEKVKDQRVLLQVLRGEEKKGKITGVAYHAARYLTDPDLIAEVLAWDDVLIARKAVVRWMSDDEKIHIALTYRDGRIRAYAAYSIEHYLRRPEMYLKSNEPEVRIAALRCIFDQEFLIEQYECEPSAAVRAEMADNITDTDKLVSYAIRENSEEVISACVKHLKEILNREAWKAKRSSEEAADEKWDKLSRGLRDIANSLAPKQHSEELMIQIINGISNMSDLDRVETMKLTDNEKDALFSRMTYLDLPFRSSRSAVHTASNSFPAGYPAMDEFEYIDSRFD